MLLLLAVVFIRASLSVFSVVAVFWGNMKVKRIVRIVPKADPEEVLQMFHWGQERVPFLIVNDRRSRLGDQLCLPVAPMCLVSAPRPRAYSR